MVGYLPDLSHYALLGVADLGAEQGGVMPPTAVAAVSAEPSWARVLATTVGLWVSRRLPRPGFPRAGRRPAARTRRRPRAWLIAVIVVAAVVVALAALQLDGVFAATAPRAVRSPAAKTSKAARTPGASARSAAAVRAAATQAAAGDWIVGQVSDSAIVGCYPAMCAALEADGMSPSRLMPLGPALAGALSADVIVTSPAAGQRLAAQYAPALIARFGSGGSRIAVRAVARAGTAAYKAAMRSDFTARTSAGTELLSNPRLKFTAGETARLRAGEVDSRLIATLAMLSSLRAFRVAAFGDASPGVRLLFRDVIIVNVGHGDGAATLAPALAMVNGQEPPYLPASTAIVRLRNGQAALHIQFAEPSPLGLFTPVLTAHMKGN